MFSLSLLKQREAEQLRRERENRVERLIKSEAHAQRTASLAQRHHQRVAQWIEHTSHDLSTLQLQEPSWSQYEEKQDQTVALPELHSARSSSSQHSARSRSRSRKRLQKVNGAVMFRDREPEKEIGTARISARNYIPERDRINQYLDSFEHSILTHSDPYADPMPYQLRKREPEKEVCGEFKFKFRTEQERIAYNIKQQEILTASQIANSQYTDTYSSSSSPSSPRSASTSPSRSGGIPSATNPAAMFRGPPDPKSWIAGKFIARFPASLEGTFSPIKPDSSPYADPKDFTQSFRKYQGEAELPNAPRFTSRVPTGKFIALPKDNPRAPRPHVEEYTTALDHDAGKVGVFALESHRSTSSGYTQTGADSSRRSRSPTYWKTVVSLAHQPGMNGPTSTYTPRGTSTTTQQQILNDPTHHLYRTYRDHLLENE